MSAKPFEVMAIFALLLNDTISFIDFITLWLSVVINIRSDWPNSSLFSVDAFMSGLSRMSGNLFEIWLLISCSRLLSDTINVDPWPIEASEIASAWPHAPPP